MRGAVARHEIAMCGVVANGRRVCAAVLLAALLLTPPLLALLLGTGAGDAGAVDAGAVDAALVPDILHLHLGNPRCAMGVWSPVLAADPVDDAVVHVTYVCKPDDGAAAFAARSRIMAHNATYDVPSQLEVGPPSVFTRDGVELAWGAPGPDAYYPLEACAPLAYQNTSECHSCYGTALAPRFCAFPPVPPPAFESVAWSHRLERLTVAEAASCRMGLLSRASGGTRWRSVPYLVDRSFSVSMVGHGLSRGHRIRNGPYANRVVFATRLDCAWWDMAHQSMSRAAVVYSDDGGFTWTMSQVLPLKWTECHVTETRSGSILVSSRLDAVPWVDGTPRRMMARSDDGGATWAEIWDVTERQPWIQIPRIASGLSIDYRTGHLYWGVQNQLATVPKKELLLLRSTDDGATWETVRTLMPIAEDVGYSDTLVVDGTAFVAFMSRRNGRDPAKIEVIAHTLTR